MAGTRGKTLSNHYLGLENSCKHLWTGWFGLDLNSWWSLGEEEEEIRGEREGGGDKETGKEAEKQTSVSEMDTEMNSDKGGVVVVVVGGGSEARSALSTAVWMTA